MPRTLIDVQVTGLDGLQKLNSALGTFERRCQSAAVSAVRFGVELRPSVQAIQGLSTELGRLNNGLMMQVDLMRQVASVNRTMNQILNQATSGVSAHQRGVTSLIGTMIQYKAVSFVWEQTYKAITDTLKATQDFDVQMRRISRVQDSANMGFIKAGMVEEISRTGASIDQLGEAFYQLGTPIKDTTVLFSAVQTAMNLVVGTQSDVRQTTRAMIQVYAQFGDQLDQTVGQAENMRRIGELLAISFKGADAEVDELTAALKYLGPIAEAAGVPLQQVMGTLTALSSTGQRGRMAGTEAGQFISTLITKYNAELGGIVNKGFVYKFKLERTDAGGIDLEKTLENIIKIAQELPTDKAQEFLKSIAGSQNSFRFLGTEGVETMRHLKEEITKAKEALEGKTHEAERLKDAMLSIPQEFGRLWNGMMGGLISLSDGTGFTKFIHDMANGFEEIAKGKMAAMDVSSDEQRRLSGQDKFSASYQRSVLGEFLKAGNFAKKDQPLLFKGLGDKVSVMDFPQDFWTSTSETDRKWIYQKFGFQTKGDPGMFKGGDNIFGGVEADPNIPWAKIQAEYDRLGQVEKQTSRDMQGGFGVSTGPDGSQRIVPRSNSKGYIESQIERLSRKYAVDPKLIHGILMAETGMHHTGGAGGYQISSAGAIGIGQLMPGTAKGLGVNPYDLDQNLEGSVRYMAENAKLFPGSLDEQIAAYNAGAGAVKKAHGVPKFAETQAYVRNVYKFMGMDYGGNPDWKQKVPDKPRKERGGGDPVMDALKDSESVVAAQIEVAMRDLEKGNLGKQILEGAFLAQVGPLFQKSDQIGYAKALHEGDKGFMTLWKGGIRPSTGFIEKAKDVFEKRQSEQQKSAVDSLGAQYEYAKGRYGVLDPRTQAAAEAYDTAAGASYKGAEAAKYRLGLTGPLVEHQRSMAEEVANQRNRQREGWRPLPFGSSYNRFELLAMDQQAGGRRLDYAQAAAERTLHPNAFRTPGTSADQAEIGVQQKKIDLLNAEIARQEKVGDTSKAYQENLESLRETSRQLNFELTNLKDKVRSEEIQKTVAKATAGFDLQRSDLEWAQSGGSPIFRDKNEAVRYQQDQAQRQADLENIIYEAMLTMKDWFGADAVDAQKRRSDRAQAQVGRIGSEYARGQAQSTRDQVQSTISDALMNSYHSGKSLGGVFSAVGGSIVDTAMQQTIKVLFDPVVNAITDEILELQGVQYALKDNTAALRGQGPTAGGAGGGGGGRRGGRGSLGSRLVNGKGNFQDYATAGLAAYSIYDNGAQNGINAGGILGGAMTGFAIGGPIGAAVGGLLNVFGGLFGHKSTPPPVDNPSNPAFYNTPQSMEWAAYRYRATGQMPNSLNVHDWRNNAPIVNVYVDGVKTQVQKQINQQTTIASSSNTSTYMDYHRPVG